MGRRASVQAPVGDPTIEDLAASWARHLRAAPYSARTLDVYARAMATLLQFLKDQGMPLTARAVTREHIEAFVAARLAGVNAHTGRALRPATARVEYAALLRFWAWAVEEGEIAVSPMVHIVAPRIVVDPVRVLTEAELAALLKTCDGASFRQRRDMALLRLLIDTGMRRAECAALTLAAVDLEQDVARVLGKGEKMADVSVGRADKRALDRYLRLRNAGAAGRGAGAVAGLPRGAEGADHRGDRRSAGAEGRARGAAPPHAAAHLGACVLGPRGAGGGPDAPGRVELAHDARAVRGGGGRRAGAGSRTPAQPGGPAVAAPRRYCCVDGPTSAALRRIRIQFFGKDLRKSALRETLPNVLIEVHRLGCAQCGEVGWKNQ